MMQDGFDGTLGQQGAELEADIGSIPDLGHRGVDQPRQVLATEGLGEHRAHPAAGNVGLVGFTEAAGGAHDAVLQHRALAIAGLVERRQHVGRELRRLVEHCRHHVRGSVLEPGQGCDVGQAADMPQRELDVGERVPRSCS